jgi:cytoskeletal protein CcmA (bactofilin family)
MSLFRRKDEAGRTAEAAPTTIAATRDPDLAVPPFRPSGLQVPQPGPAAPKPTAPPANAPATATGARAPSPAATPGAAAPAASGVARGPSRTEGAERRTLVIGKGISLQGTVSDAERLVIEGTMESQLLQAQELVIGHSGVFKGEAQVENAEIAGTFDGTLNASGSLTIRATGRVIGTARARRLSVEEGGQLSGRMEMISDTPAAPAATPTPPRLAPAPVTSRSSEPADA